MVLGFYIRWLLLVFHVIILLGTTMSSSWTDQ
ncbi:hypothetical protein LINPERHAP1_LOCUS25318 [Linum perenne]